MSSAWSSGVGTTKPVDSHPAVVYALTALPLLSVRCANCHHLYFIAPY